MEPVPSMKAKIRPFTAEDLAEARRRGEEAARTEPRLERARYDARKKSLILSLRKGAVVFVPIHLLGELRGATPRQLAEAKASRFGDAIVFEDFDMHISVKGLMRDLVGLTGAAAVLGSAGGKAKSPAKASAARTNGKRGGRPRKNAPP
jgi:Protein of unknown function (DUF2442)